MAVEIDRLVFENNSFKAELKVLRDNNVDRNNYE
jgi:hypothetical protein